MKAKGRPAKYRIIGFDPSITQFSPRGKPGRPDEISLAMDEFESIRLTDHKGLSQQQAASCMRISQQTYSRILKRAHKIVADALVNGKIIKIQGGYYVVSSRQGLQQGSPNKPQE